MIDAIDRFFQTQGFMPHGMCLLWKPSVLWTMVIGNGTIALAYFLIPIALIYLIVKRKDIGFKWIFVLFGAFILACGVTHVMAIITLWKPVYGVEGIILVITGIISLATAFLLWPLLPKLFTIPSPWVLEEMNANLQQKNRELAATELMQSKLAAIVQHTDEAIISKDLHWIITSWNQGAQRLYGYSADEAIGQPITLIIPKSRLDEFEKIKTNIIAGEAIHLLETERQHKDGHLIPVSVSVSPIRNKQGNVSGACSIGRDITEWKKIQKMKDEFVSIVSHELRTPLTSVQGSLALLVAGTAGELPEKAQKLLQIGKQNTERLVRLINDILDIAKIESGTVDFKIESIDIANVVEKSLVENQAFADKFSVKLKLKEHTNVLVNVDFDRLLQVMGNLISNAIKFSDKNTTVVIVIKEQENTVRVSVTNKGPTIPEHFEDKVFKKFSQLNTQTSRNISGTGLGLSISKEIIERLHGNIGFTSKHGETTFFFELPIASKVSVEKKVFHKIPTVLICQDEVEATQNLKTILAENGFNVITAMTTRGAREIITKNHIDALLIDLRLPEQDTIGFIKDLRRDYTAQELPLIVMSFDIQNDKGLLNGNAFSVFDWLDKPVNLDHLLNVIKSIKNQIEGRTPKVLMIEDEIDLIEVVANGLQNEADLVGATTIKAAKAELEKEKYDLVILDLLLPDGSGVELIPQISKKSIPVVVFSAYELPHEFTPFVVKALLKSKTSPHDFLQTIKNSIYAKKLRQKQLSDDDASQT